MVKERRARAYSMYLKGFSEEQIAEKLHVNQSTISRALVAKRRENAALFEREEGEILLRSFLQEEKDRYLDLLQEEWNHYYSIVEINAKGRIRALSVIRATLAAMSNMSGRLGAQLDTLRMTKEVDELLVRVKALGQDEQGRVSH
jgi:transcriptional regulator with XRE-family HTH domain